MINPTEIFVTNQRVIRYKHEDWQRRTRRFAVFLGMFSCDILLKPKFPGIDPIVIHTIDKNKTFDVDAIITTGIRDAEYEGGRSLLWLRTFRYEASGLTI